jgi:hypothetical protein
VLPRPTPLVAKCRAAIAAANAAFWRAGWKLHDLKVRDQGLHKRLLAIAAFDRASPRTGEVALFQPRSSIGRYLGRSRKGNARISNGGGKTSLRASLVGYFIPAVLELFA